MIQGMPPPRKRKTKVMEMAFGLAPNEVEVEGIEVTQVVQDANHSVQLIAGKPSAVRVYLGRTAGSVINLRGEISVRRTPGGPTQNVPSLDTVRVNPAQNGQLRRKREDLRLSLNFLLPDSLTSAGRIFLSVGQLTNATNGEAVTCSNCAEQVQEVSFVESPPLRVRLIKLRYRTSNPSATHLPSARDIALLISWLGRAYPVSHVGASERTVEANFAPPFDEDDDTCDIANAQLAAIRNLDIDGGADQRTHYYGLVADSGGFMRGCANNIPGSADPTAVASGPTGPSGYAWDTDGSFGDWYGAHELAHTFGRLHPGFCNGNSGDDPEYPFAGGQLSNDDGAFVGFDVGDRALGLPMKALPGTRWHDVMTYCVRQWMSSYTYEGIRGRLRAEDALGPTPAVEGFGLASEANPAEAARELEVFMATGDFINVVGTVNLTRKIGKIRYVNLVTNVLAPATGGDGYVLLRTKSANDQLLGEFPVRVKLNTCSNRRKEQTGIVDVVIPSHPGARALELVIGGQVVDAYRAAAVPPDLSNLRGPGGGGDVMAFAWDVADSEGINIFYNIQVSTDNGHSWQTVAVGLTSPDVEIDRSQFAPGTEVTVRVTATDGFTSKVVTSDKFSIEGPQ